MGGAVIELDLTEPWDPGPPPERRWPPRTPAWLLPVVVTVATLLTVTAAAAPRRWDPVLSLREANTTVRFGPDDTAYVMTQRTRSGRLQAYPPGRARPRWTVNFPGGYPVPTFVDDDPGLLILSVFDTDPTGRGADNLVQGRDALTGRPLWSRPGTSLLGLGPDVAVVTNRMETGGPVGSGGAPDGAPDGASDGAGLPAPVIEAVDRRTGRPHWTREVPSDVLVGWSDADAVVEVAPAGGLRVTDASTGAVRGESRITLLGQPFHVYSDGDLAVVYQQLPGGDPSAGQLIVAYDLASGAERWREDAQRHSYCELGYRYRCEIEPGELTVTEVASGAVRYRGPADQHVVRDDRLIVTATPDPARPPATRVYDLRTGRLLRTLPGWTYTEFRPDSMLMVQLLSGSGLLVATFDDVTGRLTVLGRATGWTGGASCVRGLRYVGCTGASGLRIWPLDR